MSSSLINGLAEFIITPLFRWITLLLTIVLSILLYLNQPQRFSYIKGISGLSYKWELYILAIFGVITTTLTFVGLWIQIPFTNMLPDYWYMYIFVLYLAIITQITVDSEQYTDDGSFNDLYYNVKGGKVKKNKTLDSAVLGDIHYGHHDQPVLDTTFNILLKKLKPNNLVLHDVFDGHSISHHEVKNPFSQYKKEMDGSNSLKKEIDNLLEWFESLKKMNFNNIIVARANHDDFIDRWLVDTDWRKTVTPKNSLEYMEYSLAILKGDANNGIIPWILHNHSPKVMAFGRNDSHTSLGWELAQHGDRGTNGSRGSLVQFHNLATKIIVGHYHSPGRKDGALAVGTSTLLRLPYNIGPSSWMHAHVITHHDGKAQHVFFHPNKDGVSEYTTFK